MNFKITSLKEIITFSFQENFSKFIFLLFGLSILSLLEVLGIASVGPFVAVISDSNLIFENNQLSYIYYYFNFSSTNNFVIALGFLSIFLIVFSNFMNAIILWQITYFAKMQGYIISKKLLSIYLTRDYGYFLNKHSAEISRNILSEVKRVVDGIILPILQLIARIIVCIAILIFLVFLNFQITLPIVIIILTSYLIFFYFIKDVQLKIGKETTKTVLLRFKILSEVINGIKLIKLNSVENKFITNFSKYARKEAILDTKGTLIAYLPRYFIETIIIVLTISLIMFLYHFTSTNINNLYPLFVVYALAALRLMPSIQQIYVSSSLIKYNLEAYKILIKDFDYNLSKDEETSRNTLIKFENYIRFEDVSYKYNNSEKILKNINFKINKFSSLGIVGKSGAGKSTLVDILCGLLIPYEGNIIIDHKKFKSLNINAWKSKIGYVTQDTFLFDGTLAENIAFPYHMEKINYEMIKSVIRQTNLEEFVLSLKDTYHSNIGELGKKISGGQKQRLGIARALYRSPEIIVLDEATSALDRLNEKFVVESINLLKNKITMIIISHKTENIKNCDNIILIDDNEIKLSDKYDNIKNNNTFNKFFDYEN